MGNHLENDSFGELEPEISYDKMISLIRFRKDRLIDYRKCFKSYQEIESHIETIEKEKKVSKKEVRMLELKNWLNSFN